MRPPQGHFEFTATEITELLQQLDARLKKRDTAGSVFIVGGAAIAVTSDSPSSRRTEDIDAISDDDVVFEEARAIAREQGIPSDWLNGSARMWMPPLPELSRRKVRAPGLHITYASAEFLFANKLIAQRSKDAADLRLLAARLGLARPSAEVLEEIIRRYYTDQEALEFIVDGPDVDARYAYYPSERRECSHERERRSADRSTVNRRVLVRGQMGEHR